MKSGWMRLGRIAEALVLVVLAVGMTGCGPAGEKEVRKGRAAEALGNYAEAKQWYAQAIAVDNADGARLLAELLVSQDAAALFGASARKDAQWVAKVQALDAQIARLMRQAEANGVSVEGVKEALDIHRKAIHEVQEALDKAAAEEKVAEERRKAVEAAWLKAEVEARIAAEEKAGETRIILLPEGESMVMVWCPPGTFMMGSDDGYDDEKPVHNVTLTKGFWMAETEVTRAQWWSVMGGKPTDFVSRMKDDHPVACVSWNRCQEFCKKTGLRLPTEAEWEYACRAGTTGAYGGTGNLKDMGWYGGNSGSRTQPVGQKQPNAWGLYDMHGNVWEWCQDWKGDYPGGAVTDPKGAGSGGYRVLRGGSIESSAEDCRSAGRRRASPSRANDVCYGFRPVACQE